MGDATRRFALPAGPSGVARASDWLRSLGEEFGLSAEETYRLDLCAGELLTNVLAYAYPSDEGGTPHSIGLRAQFNERRVALEIVDDGRPFDPLAWRGPGAPRSLAEAESGGSGLLLVKRFADECRYARRDDRNVMRLVIRRGAVDGRAAAGARLPRGPGRRGPAGAVALPVRRADGTLVRNDERQGLDRRLLGFIWPLAIFRGVPCHLVEEVVASCRLVRFHDGAVMLRPGQPNDAMAFVINGRLRVHLDAPDSPTYFVIAAGDCVGELSVIDGRARVGLRRRRPGYPGAAGRCRYAVRTATRDPRREPQLHADPVRPGAAPRSSVVEQIRWELDLAHLQRDLGFAREIQAGMLPQESPLFPDREEVDCAARLLAARQVGGDFYDAFFIDSTRLFVTIGDVCGKGLPAALFMVRALTVLRGEATRRTGTKRAYVQRVVERVNRLLVERNEQSLFVSLFCALLDTATGTLAYVSAGHNPPALALGGGPLKP